MLERARKLRRFFTQPFFVAEPYTCRPHLDATLPTRRWDRETPRIFVLSNLRFNRRTGVHENTWLILRLGDRRMVRRSLRVRLWTRRQWEQRLRAAGMRLVRAYADLNGSPYRTASGRLVLAEKR